MIDFARIDGFEWDSGNERKNIETHGVSQSEAEQIFFNQPMRITTDSIHSAHEARWLALGVTDEGRRLLVVFTLRAAETIIRVISARDMSRKERRIYAEETQADTGI
jgi:uncharacterized DUF497 family protein